MGGCSISKLLKKPHKKNNRRASSDYYINSGINIHARENRRKSQPFDFRLSAGSVPRNFSLLLIFPHEDDQIRQIRFAAETLGHKVTSIQINYQQVYEWLKKQLSSSHNCNTTRSLLDETSSPAAQMNVTTTAAGEAAMNGQFAPVIHQMFGDENLLPSLELVIIDRRISSYNAVADCICEYFRHHLNSGFDAVIVALLPSPKSSTPADLLDSGIIQAGFSRLLYQSDLMNTGEICRELLIFQCHDIAMLRRLRQASSKQQQQQTRNGSNGYLASSNLENRNSAPHLSRAESAGTTSDVSLSSTTMPQKMIVKGRSASISGTLMPHYAPTSNSPQLSSQNTLDSSCNPISHSLMEPIVENPAELDEKSQEQIAITAMATMSSEEFPIKGKDSTVKTPTAPENSTKMRRFSFDPSNLLNTMTSKLSNSFGGNPNSSGSASPRAKLLCSLTKADLDKLDPHLLSDWANGIIQERETKLKQCQAYRRAKRFQKLATPSSNDIVGLDKRKDSWARLSNFNIDSPLSQVVQLINSAQARSSSPVAKDLQKALELMFSNDLFSGLLKTNSPNFDQMTADLIGGLMTNLRREEPIIARGVGKGSLEAGASTPTGKPRLSDRVFNPHVLSNLPGDISQCLENDNLWCFDVIALERVTLKKPLVYLGMRVFDRFNVLEYLRCSEQVMAAWLQVIEEHYRPSNQYHNSTHAADVMQSASVFLLKENVREVLDPIDEVATLLAAVIHDVDHPGRTNPFLVNSGHELAILYNDLAVLESHHAALGFQLSKDDRVNIFKNLPAEDFRNLRKQIIDLVLATEMARHFEHVTKFVNNLSKPMLKQDEDSISQQSAGSTGCGARGGRSNSIGSTSSSLGYTMDDASVNAAPSAGTRPDNKVTLASLVQGSPENRSILKRMIIKCSDVNNPTRELRICKEWAIRIAEEYFAQTDDEKRLGLPLVMPTFDRLTCNIPKSQTSFIDFFLKDMFAAIDAVCDCPEILSNLETNYAYWSERILQSATGIQSNENEADADGKAKPTSSNSAT